MPVLEPFQSLFEEPPPPAVNHLRAGIKPGRNIHVCQPRSSKEHDLGSDHPPVRVRVAARFSSLPPLAADNTISNGLTLPRATASLHTPRTQRRPHPLAATPIKSHQCSSAVDHLVGSPRRPCSQVAQGRPSGPGSRLGRRWGLVGYLPVLPVSPLRLVPGPGFRWGGGHCSAGQCLAPRLALFPRRHLTCRKMSMPLLCSALGATGAQCSRDGAALCGRARHDAST